MKSICGFLTIAVACTAANAVAADPPAWAYGFPTTAAAAPAPAGGAGRGAAPAAAQPAPDTSLKTLPGSTLQFTRAQIANRYGAADWFPEDHPKMPDVVARGKAPEVWGCSLCHYPNGKGRAENAGVAGLPVSYFIQTMNDFKDGNRKSADSRKANTNIMIGIAKGMTPEEIKAAAEYYGSMKWTPWMTKVVETETVPKTRIAGGLFLTLEGNEKEPIAGRIIEVPVDAEATETLRDPRSGFIVYAPPGSLRKGQALVKAGQCTMCHGSDLLGLGPVPGIAGRSPSYEVRQLFDMQAGTRKGQWTELMKPVVAKLSNEDMGAIGAYLATLKP